MSNDAYLNAAEAYRLTILQRLPPEYRDRFILTLVQIQIDIENAIADGYFIIKVAIPEDIFKETDRYLVKLGYLNEDSLLVLERHNDVCCRMRFLTWS
jgi:hypothetical protein